MSFGNRQFVVNGEMDNPAMFEATVRLALEQAGFRDIDGYKIHPDKGMLLYWSESDGMLPFPFGNTLEQVIDFAWIWLKSNPKLSSNPDKWEGAVDHYGSNEQGWKIYTEDWGQVTDSYVFAAIKPIVCWYGK